MDALIWLVPSLTALVLYGVAQGLVKKSAIDVSPARFCLFFIVARSAVFMAWFLTHDSPPIFSAESRPFLLVGILAYVLDGIGWILYYKSVLLGPISIVGTLSAAYPAPTLLFARVFLSEALTPLQYVGVGAILAGCVGLSYEPTSPLADPAAKRDRSWMPLAIGALVLWGAAQTLVKHAYNQPNASDISMSLLATLGGLSTLGVYGILYGRKREGGGGFAEWKKSFVPMAVMAGGDLGVIIATVSGPVSIVTPLTGAYPMITVPFAAWLLNERVTAMRFGFILAVVGGMIALSV